MARNLLQLVGDFSITQGIPKPTVVTASTDETTIQIWGLLNDEVMELGDRHDWEALRSRYSFAHANGTAYLALTLSTLAGYKRLIPSTLWNETIDLPVNGPISPEDWRAITVMGVAGALENFRVYAGGLYIYPVPTDLATVYSGEYQSTAGVIAADTTIKDTFTLDTDTPRLPDRLVYAGLRWRWKMIKGQAYAEEKAIYELMVAQEMNGDTAQGDLRMDRGDPDSRVYAPGLLIAAGSWDV